MSYFDIFAHQLVNGIVLGSFYALVALGYTMVFGVVKLLNFAHGELYMVGAYAVVAVYAGADMPFAVAVAAGLVFVGALGLLMEWGLFRPLRENPLGGLIASIGFLLILQSLAVLAFGLRAQNVPPISKERLFVGGAVLTYERLLVIVVTLVLLGALWLFLRRTRFGWALRAVAQDREAAALQGISIMGPRASRCSSARRSPERRAR